MNRLRSLTSAVIAAALVALPAVPAAAQTVSVGSTSIVDSFNGLYYSALPVVGQTFVTPTGASYLQTFTLFLGDSYNGANLRFNAGVYAAGSSTPLFTAAAGVAGSSNTVGYDTYTFGFSNLLLSPGQTYAFLLNATSAADGDENGAVNLVGLAGDSYAGGSAVYSFGGPGALEQYDGDLAFRAEFTAAPTATTTPEPATFALVGGGLALVGVAARRRRRA